MSEKDYLKKTADGVEITFATPVDVAGAQVSKLTMREPTVRDLEAAENSATNESARELKLFANLMEIGDDDIRGMKVRNFRRVQAAYGVFSD